jgi:hypothetical protein
MIVKRQILVKAVVTPQLKEQLIEEVQSAIRGVEEAQDELERQTRRLMLELQRTDLNRAMAVRQQLDVERRRQEDAKAELQEQLKEYEQLVLGEEFARGAIEGHVTLQEGDNLTEKLGRAEILVEDDVIKEIRDPAAAG